MKNSVKVVLLHPPLRNVVRAATPDYVDENRGHMPPMGLLYIQAAIEKSRHESVFLDGDLEGWNHEETARKALTYSPDLIGLQAMSFTMPDVCLVARAIKQLDNSVSIVVGGPHPTIYPVETATLECIDFAFVGEGESRIVQFLDAFDDADACSKIAGIACGLDQGISYSPSHRYVSDLDSLAFPARKSSRYKGYSSVLGTHKTATVMITSRGCPFDCIFCNRMGRKWRYHSPRYVLDEIEQITELEIGEIFIHDDTFSINRERVAEICRGIIHRGLAVEWEARTRADCVDEELLALMRKAGCQRLSFGVESGSERVLENMRKGVRLEQVEKAFSSCRREGLLTLADFMLGNLGETREDIEKTMSFVKRLQPDFVQFSICSPYPGTPLYQIALERGLLQSDVWTEFARNPLQDFRSPMWTENFTEDELIGMTRSAYRDFYVSPRFILGQLKRIHSFSQFATMARAALGMMRK